VAFLQGFLQKSVFWTWFFAGVSVVDCMVDVVF
jgi:hypothetical protein